MQKGDEDEKKECIEVSRKLLNDDDFRARHRTSDRFFTRCRKLTFVVMILLLLRKSAKSIQSVVNEFFLLLGIESVTGAAFSRARAHIRHTAFIELNEKAVVEVMYRDGQYLRYKRFRMLAIDGSKIRLPETQEINEAFGQITYTNGQEDAIKGCHTYAQGSVLYDVLNHIAIEARLGRGTDYEVDLAIQHLDKTQEGDLIIADRGYASYFFLARLHQAGRDFVVRCSSGSFQAAQAMFSGQGPASQQVTLTAPQTKKELIALGLPKHLTVRFVRVLLETGEYEVLVTSLLDEVEYPSADFKEIYWLRWGVETFYGVAKTRLQLENFTGKTVESIQQDFYATIYITGLESILTDPAEKQLSQRNTQHVYHVNKVVSFNVIKNEVIDLLYHESDLDVLLKKLTRLFLKNPSCTRKNRKVPRRKSSDRKLLNHHKRLKKICF
jgi:hypothetical protein